MAKTALLITNPNSRSGAEADIAEGIQLMEAAGFEVIKGRSEKTQDTQDLIEKYHPHIDLVIIGGGDGSIHSAAEILYRYQLTLAVLPLGTANDLARSLELPEKLIDVFDLIVKGHKRKIDLAMVNGCYFFNVANIGLGVRVTRELTPEVKKTWGVFSYLKAMLSALKKIRKFRANIVIDGKLYRLASIQVAVGNGRYYGGGNIIDETAAIDDGWLNLYSLKPQSHWQLFLQALLLRQGRHREAKGSFNAVGRRIEITTTPQRDIYADGEPMGSTPAIFELKPLALEVICGNLL